MPAAPWSDLLEAIDDRAVTLAMIMTSQMPMTKNDDDTRTIAGIQTSKRNRQLRIHLKNKLRLQATGFNVALIVTPISEFDERAAMVGQATSSLNALKIYFISL